MEKMTNDVNEAHKLQTTIINLVFDYVDDDDTRSTFGINAVHLAGVQLVKDSSMSVQTRMNIAMSLFQDLTDDIQSIYPDKL